jgi:hypothetical protein
MFASAERAIREHGDDWTDDDIAAVCGIDPGVVASVRRDLAAEAAGIEL